MDSAHALTFAMTKSRRRCRHERERQRYQLRIMYDWLYDAVLAILATHDPIGIAFHPYEYEPEVGSILPRLGDAASAGELTAIIHDEFARWFSPHMAGKAEGYRPIAEEIWEAYLLWASGWWPANWKLPPNRSIR